MDWDWDRLRERCLREARRAGLDRADAEDAAQESLLRAWRFRAACLSPHAPDAWAGAIGRREAARLAGRPRDLAVGGADEVAGVPAVDAGEARVGDHAIRVHDRLRLAQALAELPPGDQALLTVRYDLGVGQAELARLMGIPGGTAAIRLHRARGRLRGLLSEDDDPID